MDSKLSTHPKSSSFTYSTFTGNFDTIPREVSETWPRRNLLLPGSLWGAVALAPIGRERRAAA